MALDAGVLSQRALRGLKTYQYQAGGYTWLDDAHQPFWNFCVSRLPMWLAPNLITLAGTLAIVAAYALNVYYNPSFTGEAPAWVYVVTSASVAIYVNLDCMDGKQARRTGSSSPLGQLFDHGCDALALHMMLGNIASSLGVGCGWKMAAGCLGIMVPWMLAQWEEFHTGVMMYGNACYGVLEANYSICAVHLLSAALGLRFWRAELTLPAPLSHALQALAGLGAGSGAGAGAGQVLVAAHGNGTLGYAGGAAAAGGGVEPPLLRATVAEVALVVVGLAGVLQGVSNVARVFASPPLPPQAAGHKQLGRRWALLHLLGLLATVLLGAASVAWSPCTSPASTTHPAHAASSTTTFAPAPSPAPAGAATSGNPLSSPDGLLLASWTSDATLCRASFSTFGVLYALAATQLIVAHMAKEPWAPSLVAVALPALTLAAAVGGWPSRPRLVVTAHVLALAVYANYVKNVIAQICAHLGVRCLTIKPRPPSPPGTPAAAAAEAAAAAAGK